ncbi:MAG: hypothetical protein M3O50_12390, partial [Myxococcota bacterium]|nr:hypothetical protein [Myxococcota bacterium]
GLAKLLALGEMSALRDYVEEGPTGKRRLPVLEEEDDDEGDASSECEIPTDGGAFAPNNIDVE